MLTITFFIRMAFIGYFQGYAEQFYLMLVLYNEHLADICPWFLNSPKQQEYLVKVWTPGTTPEFMLQDDSSWALDSFIVGDDQAENAILVTR